MEIEIETSKCFTAEIDKRCNSAQKKINNKQTQQQQNNKKTTNKTLECVILKQKIYIMAR